MKKYYIITLLILLSCNVWAQEDYCFSVQKNRPVETVEPDVLSAQPYNEQSSEETEDILVSRMQHKLLKVVIKLCYL